MDSSYINSDSLNHSDSNESTIPFSINSPLQSSSITTLNKFKDLKYNKSDYKLDNTKSYIFDNKLFTRTLLDIDFNKEREILIECTTCNYKKVEKIPRFLTSNYTKHYKYKHPNIAYNKESEKTRKRITDIPKKQEFFNQLESRKRNRTDTLIDFNESEAYNKILNFIIQNNLSFNILNSNSFKDLLNYYNRLNPIINRYKIKLFSKRLIPNTY